MTLLQQAPVATATGPTVRSTWRRNRAAVGLVALLLLVLAVLAFVTGVGTGGALDPRSYAPTGARALATLLEDQGVPVVRTSDVPSTVSGADRRTTLFVPQPGLLSEPEIAALAAAGMPVVFAGADPDAVKAMGIDAAVVDLGEVEDRDPGCALQVADIAGRALAGGFSYQGGDERGCYRAGRGSSLLPLGDVVLLGTAEGFTNDHLDEQGNAALALGLLGQGSELRWLIPAADRDALGPLPVTSPGDLLPTWVRFGALQLGVALVVLALWRARRLGRVVTEPLPVVVRAAETVEGRGRLYRAAGSRDTAAEALRAGARARLAGRTGAGRNPGPEVLVDLVARWSSRSPVGVQALLYGPSPADDAALVRLADDLDALTQEVAGP